MSSEQDGDTLPVRELLFQRSQERAYSCLNDKEYSRAFAHFLVALTIEPDVDDALLDMFLFTLGKLANNLEVEQNWQELLLCYERSLELLPYNSHILHGLATILFRLGHIESAINYFQKAYRENPFFTPSLYCMDNIKNALVERWHFIMVNDRCRNATYLEAIDRAVKAGYNTVLDIGAGSGILSLMAANSGADKVFACEGNSMMFSILQKVIEANSKSIQALPKFSYDLTLPEDIPERVALVVTEIFDAGLFGENVLSTLKHAWEHLIKTGNPAEEDGIGKFSLNDTADVMAISTSSHMGKVIPHSATLWAVPIECEKIKNDYGLDQKVSEAFGITNTSISARISDSEPYTTEKLANIQGGYKFLSSPKAALSANFNDIKDITSLLNGKNVLTSFEVTTSGRVDAVAVWFDLNLDELSSISTGPENETSCWEQSIFCVLPKHLKECSSLVNTGNDVEVSFLCKGHLTLQSVVTPHISNFNIEKVLSIDPYVIQCLNSYSASGVLSSCPKMLDAKSPLIDISPFPSLGLKALKDGIKNAIVLPSKYLMDINELRELCAIPRERIKSMSYEDICSQSVKCLTIFCEPVEVCGLLKKNIFEDIALLRTLSQNEPPLVFPRKISVFASLVESSDLLKQARLTSDENCMGYKVSQFLNVYQSVVQQDIQLCTLPHEQLCDVTKLCDIEIDKLVLENGKLQSFIEFQGSTKVLIKKSGEVSGIPFWFSLHYDKDCTVDTLCAKSPWKQAVIIPESKIIVLESEQVVLEWTCRNSCLNISMKKG